ncbi:MAG: MvdC/MvdD family ATP grasp protein, partial [Sciscionella sp.]
MSVLILAEDVDATADQVVRALTDREVVVYRVNTAWFPAQLSMSTELRGGRWAGSLRTPARVVDLESVTAVWYRTPRAYQFPIGLSAAERLHANLEAKYGLGGVLTSLGALWVNHPARLADAAYKPVQLVTAHRCGLAVPDSVITNDADTVRAFAASGKTITKILGANTILEDGVRKVCFTRVIGDTDLADLQGIHVTTHFFQRWVPKAYEARMIVIGDHITTAAIRAGTAEGYIDWRADYEGLSYDLVDPPTDVLAGVRELMPALGLRRRHRNPPDPATRRPPRERHPVTDTGTRTDAAWTARAERLAALLTKQGDLSDDAWRAAVAAVPRHLLVPTAYRQDTTTGAWRQIDTRSDEGLDLAYSPETLITALDGRSGYQVPVSSSTKPDLMVRMLQILDVHDGHRVLEIGTGTGYNAALLTHR